MIRFRKFPSLKWDKNVIIIIVVLVALSVMPSQGSDCRNNPCMYGICVNETDSSYRCYCIDGYTGINCEINWDDCWSNPCLNGGTCNDAIASYNCTCLEGYIGISCEQKYSECMNHPCLNNGTCLDHNGFTCQCLEGFSGEYCEIDESVCNSTICKNNGECVEGAGLSFSCRCAPGWTGKFCEEDVNECTAVANISPCLNSGLCINIPGSYTCACLFGFTGKNCDKNVVSCPINPCQNDAVCLYEDDQPICYCVPDYHGTFCEQRYDDCESKNARCENGGTCIDGINNFTCSCPPPFAGDVCTQVIVVDLDTTTVTSGELLPQEETTGPLYYDTTKDVATEDFTTIFDLTDGTTGGFVVDETTTPLVHESRTEAQLSTRPTIELTAGVMVEDTTLAYTYPTSEDSIVLGVATTSITEIGTRTTETDNEIAYTEPALTPVVPVVTQVVPDTTLDSVDETTVGFTTTISLDIPVFTDDSYDLTTSWPSLDRATAVSTSSESARAIDADYDETSSNNSISVKATTSRVITMLPSTIPPATGEPLTQREESSDKYGFPTESVTLSTASQDDFITVTEFHKTTFGTEFDQTEVTAIPTTPYQLPHACTKDECANTSLCLHNFTQCDCSYRHNCRKYPSRENAAFNGKSYIRQKFIIDNGTLNIFLRLKTKAKSGILIHALFDDERFALLYMEMGQLKFQFSCGLQTMLFGELDTPINNGYDVNVEMRFQYIVENVSDKCLARLLVNDTVAMSGEQVLQSHDIIPQFARLHLGGIPVAFSHQLSQIVLGFIGCMSLLKVNNVQRDFILDSIEAVQIEECNSFLCLSNPCKNFGACEEVDGKITCKCAAGYKGEFCEKSVCDDNPCYLGATCLIAPGVNFICICPLGTHGLFCEKDTTILQPSFSVFSPGFSSYMAYGISSSIKDNMDLSLRIIPQTLEQISLIAYMGQSGSSRESSDHISITFVRGYIMLTWDLGSGVRRIFTNSPLNARPHKAHKILVGRRGRDSWLYVEGVGNVTGRAAGANTRLDVSPLLYIGGHKSKYFDTLPHDLPLHAGFSGCIYDVELRTDENVFPITNSSPATGRGVGECHRNECSHHMCKNGAVCLNYGPTYSCICMKDWSGPDCSNPSNCTSSNQTCHKNSK